ncbi:M23 family metallopeptidase [Streptomyces sp. NBC_00059]|uniref:M23 family metallopeptidase n=1 Tax=Streptomyces sp. NBC_00059 TaxID=2975635 RepID=UPI00224DE698|nr:M23 family metallopeptidase [Streptomyces sp. NBC_00059]MCX5410615.1 M23 family metallopeptidase [Streptomyces sp. NBC_00059]
MNDQHPHAGYAGYDSHSTGFDTDPLFGTLPGQHDTSHEPAYGGGYATAYDGGGYGAYDASQWETGAHQQASYDAYGAQAHPQAPQGYDTTATWMPEHGLPAQAPAPDATGQWDTSGWDHTGQADQWATGDTGAFPTTTFDTTAYATGTFAVPAFEGTGYEGFETADTGAYDATAWNTGATPENAAYAPEQTSYPAHEHQSAVYEPYETAEFGAHDALGHDDALGTHGTTGLHDTTGGHDTLGAHDTTGAHDTLGAHDTTVDAYDEAPVADEADPLPDVIDLTAGHASGAASTAARPVGRSAAPRGGGRGRRRTPAKRSALLTVAVPSACVMSVAGIAAASVSGIGGEETKDDTASMAAADIVKPAVANNKLDTQLANLSADAENFADRASRTQERIDLKERQAAEKKKREEEAARREALRPKFVLPVKQHGLSATYGQAGVNWMSVHTGIDFPVSYGTPVMAATDGTVRTQWNSAYGNMAIVTAADGTETWYCHLSTTRIRSGSVKAGDVIAYSGNSGNSTGPHLHFEVRPGGGSAIDPMPWLRSHGINPY